MKKTKTLKKRSKYLNNISESLASLIGNLINSVDPSFPGYPYGLIDADRFARVPYKEIDYHRNMLMSQIHESKELENFVEHIYSVDTHERINDIIG